MLFLWTLLLIPPSCLPVRAPTGLLTTPGIRCSLKPLGGQCVRGRSVEHCEALCAIRGHTNKMHLKDFNVKGMTAGRTHPWIPFFGGLLLNWRVCLCLNLGGPLRGVAGPPVTLVADFISALGASRFMLRSYRRVGDFTNTSG